MAIPAWDTKSTETLLPGIQAALQKLGREDSNLRMAAPKAAAFPLGDAPRDNTAFTVPRAHTCIRAQTALAQTPKQVLLAMTYSPRDLRPKYHRRWRA